MRKYFLKIKIKPKIFSWKLMIKIIISKNKTEKYFLEINNFNKKICIENENILGIFVQLNHRQRYC